jgi:hypothetical protein
MEGAVVAKVADSARVSTRACAVWRNCADCGQLSALNPEENTCSTCRPEPAPVLVSANDRRARVGLLSADANCAVRDLYSSTAPEVMKVAALAEVAAAAASLARTIVNRRHLDPLAAVPYMTRPVDLYATLGRGRWLPHWTRPVPAPSTDPVRAGVVIPLIASATGRGIAAAGR